MLVSYFILHNSSFCIMSESSPEIPEIHREHTDRLPIAAIVVVAILVITGIGLVGFALFAGQQDNENRAISGTVSAVLAFTSTPTDTRPPTNTLPPSNTPKPTDTPAPTNTPEPVKASDTPRPTNTRTRTSAPAATRVLPTDTPVPPTATPKPAGGARGISGIFSLCSGQTQYARGERICFREFIRNHTDTTIPYKFFGVRYTNVDSGASGLHDSWTGDLKIGPNCTGPRDSCGGEWEDGIPGGKIPTAGTYRLEMVIQYTDGAFESFGSPITVTITP